VIGKTSASNKGRISRFLANKASIASRIDNFSQTAPTTKFGEALRDQVEERIAFYAEGKTPSKNIDVMKRVMDDVLANVNVPDPTAEAAEEEDAVAGVTAQATEQKLRKEKKEKKEKKENKEKKEKRKHDVDADGEKKKKKKKSKHE